MRVALVNPAWSFEGSIYFGCREPHLPLTPCTSDEAQFPTPMMATLILATEFSCVAPVDGQPVNDATGEQFSRFSLMWCIALERGLQTRLKLLARCAPDLLQAQAQKSGDRRFLDAQAVDIVGEISLGPLF